jgi:transposase
MYPSDINDKEWAILTPFVVQGKMGRPRKHDPSWYEIEQNFAIL